MNIEEVPIESLVLDPANARKHNDKNLEAIRGSLARFKQQKPIVVNKDNVVIAGNGTLIAARSLGLKTLKVIKTDLVGTDLVAYGLADNKTAELAEWDEQILGSLLASLHKDMFDVTSIGFDFTSVPNLEAANPWGENNVAGQKEGETFEGVANRILLVYDNDEYQKVLAKAQAVMQKLEIEDMSALFSKLLDEHL